MTINITIVGEKSVIVERVGLITKEQLIHTYQQLLAMDVEYAIVDDRNMMLQSHATIYNIDVQPLVESIMVRDAFRHVVIVVPEDNEMRVLIHDEFQRLNLKDKLTFADDLETAKEILVDLQS